MHGTVAYTSTLLSLGVTYVKMYQFLSSTKEDAHKKENWILFFCLTVYNFLAPIHNWNPYLYRDGQVYKRCAELECYHFSRQIGLQKDSVDVWEIYANWSGAGVKYGRVISRRSALLSHPPWIRFKPGLGANPTCNHSAASDNASAARLAFYSRLYDN